MREGGGGRGRGRGGLTLLTVFGSKALKVRPGLLMLEKGTVHVS